LAASSSCLAFSTKAAPPPPGKNGEYNYNSPTDQHLVRFLGLDLEALLKELAKGKADGEILEWEGECQDPARAVRNRSLVGLYGKARTGYDAETLSGFAEYVGHHSKTREDIKTWFDALDLDDYVSFGGKA
jgi:hypothetical protein